MISTSSTTDTSRVDINFKNYVNKSSNSKLISYGLRALSLLSYVAVVVTSYSVNFRKNQKLAQDYFLYITPSKIFFKIWPVVYTLLLLVLLQNIKRNIWKTKSNIVFIISNFVMMIQLIVWSIRTPVTIVIAGLILALVDNLTIWFWRVLIDQYNEENKIQSFENERNAQQQDLSSMRQFLDIKYGKYKQYQILIVRNVISLYIGWITVSGTVITGMSIVYTWGFSKCIQFILFWISTPAAGVGIYMFLILKLPKEYKYAFGYIIAVVWGLIGASIASFTNITKLRMC